jgi:IS5 family transposase
LLLIALYSVRSERQFCEQLEYNLLFRWFLDMEMLEDAFDASTFSRNRERLMEHEVAADFFAVVREQAGEHMSREHFSVDATLLEAWASMKSFRPKGDNGSDNNGWADFRGHKRSNDTHESKTDPESKLMRKGNGREAKLCFMGHALMENRNGLLVDLRISDGATVGADRGYDTKDFVARAREQNVTPHVAQNQNAHRSSAIDGRTTRHVGYPISQTIRMRIEQVFGWIKTVGGLRRTRYRGRRRTQHAAYRVGAAYNLLRLSRLHRLPA